ncbi:MAG: MFS transporter [Moraxellaceae bacterium]|jgi:MFS transporter, PAT family, beta-lactamase induction signal transducer AmpG|nr:MAG: MFS transporter [Moraxellaceae bacterium]
MQPTRSYAHPLLWVPSGYFTMALTYMVLSGVSTVMFKNLGMDNTQAALYSSMFILAYTIKPLFAPFIEMYRTKKFFVVATQIILAGGFAAVALAMGMPSYITLIMVLFWVLSFVGATQDIASDGVYVTTLDGKSQSRYCGVQSLSWNIGPIVATGILVKLSGYLHEHVFHHDPHVTGNDWVDSWKIVFFIIAAVTLLMSIYHWKVMPDGAKAENTPTSVAEAGRVLLDSLVDFFKKKDIWLMISFIFLYRVSVGLIEKVGPLFMLDGVEKGGMGLTNDMQGNVYGIYGTATFLAGSLLGGWLVARKGLKASLFTLCCCLNIPNVTFLILAIYQPSNVWLITLAVAIEKFFFGVGAVGLMIYMMQQLAPGRFVTAHYAFGTGLMGLCMMSTGAISGALQEHLGYVQYFIFVMIATIPSFIITWLAPFNHSDK